MNSVEVKNIILAKKMANRLAQLNLKPTEYKWAVFVLDKLLGKMQRTPGGDGIVEMPSTYIRKAFKASGQNVLRTLVNANIVESPKSWSTGTYDENPFARKYRISLDLCDFDHQAEVHHGAAPDQKEQEHLYYMEANLRALEIDLTKALINAHRLADAITLNKYDVGDEIEGETLEIYDAESNLAPWYATRENAFAYAEKHGKKLIRKQRIYGAKPVCHVVDHVVNYVADVRNVSRMAWTRQVLNLEKGVVYAIRSHTNQRVDSNVTNLPTALLEHCSVNSGESLVSIDLTNSQYAVMASMFKNGKFADVRSAFFQQFTLTEESQHYLQHCENGTVYEYFMEKLGIPAQDRNHAKGVKLGATYSSHKATTPAKLAFKKVAPQIVEIWDAFKKEYGDNQLAILNQICEAEIFIDGCSAELDKKGIWHLTKHDSVLCAESDALLVWAIVKNHLEHNGVVGQLKEPLPAHI